MGSPGRTNDVPTAAAGARVSPAAEHVQIVAGATATVALEGNEYESQRVYLHRHRQPRPLINPEVLHGDRGER